MRSFPAFDYIIIIIEFVQNTGEVQGAFLNLWVYNLSIILPFEYMTLKGHSTLQISAFLDIHICTLLMPTVYYSVVANTGCFLNL